MNVPITIPVMLDTTQFYLLVGSIIFLGVALILKGRQ